MSTVGIRVEKATKELTKRMYQKCEILYLCAAAILWRDYGWRKTRIFRRFGTTNVLWDELTSRENENISILQMLEDETGIELALPNKKSYHDYIFLDLKCWDGNKINDMQTLAMRKRQDEWMIPQLEASLLLSLHRDEGWGFDRLSNFATELDEQQRVIAEIQGKDLKRQLRLARKIAEEVTGIPARELVITRGSE